MERTLKEVQQPLGMSVGQEEMRETGVPDQKKTRPNVTKKGVSLISSFSNVTKKGVILV